VLARSKADFYLPRRRRPNDSHNLPRIPLRLMRQRCGLRWHDRMVDEMELLCKKTGQQEKNRIPSRCKKEGKGVPKMPTVIQKCCIYVYNVSKCAFPCRRQRASFTQSISTTDGLT
jgi:hypothetical protein